MAIAKVNTSHLAAVTTGQTSTAQDLSTVDYAEMLIELAENGTRTAGATAKVQWSDDAGTKYYDGPTITGPLTATSIDFTIAIPVTANRVRVVFALGTGGTSTASTCTAQCGTYTKT